MLSEMSGGELTFLFGTSNLESRGGGGREGKTQTGSISCTSCHCSSCVRECVQHVFSAAAQFDPQAGQNKLPDKN